MNTLYSICVLGVIGYCLLWMLPAYERRKRHVGEVILWLSLGGVLLVDPTTDGTYIFYLLYIALSLIQKLLMSGQVKQFVGGARSTCVIEIISLSTLMWIHEPWSLIGLSMLNIFSALFLKSDVEGRAGLRYTQLVSCWVIIDALMILFAQQRMFEKQAIWLMIPFLIRLGVFPFAQIMRDYLVGLRVHFVIHFWRVTPLFGLYICHIHRETLAIELASMSYVGWVLFGVSIASIMLTAIVHQDWWTRFMFLWLLPVIGLFIIPLILRRETDEMSWSVYGMWWILSPLAGGCLRTDERLRRETWTFLLGRTSVVQRLLFNIGLCVVILGALGMAFMMFGLNWVTGWFCILSLPVCYQCWVVSYSKVQRLRSNQADNLLELHAWPYLGMSCVVGLCIFIWMLKTTVGG